MSADHRQPVTLRHSLRPGDLGWIIHRHGVVYAQEYGWDIQCEAFIASVATAFVQQHEPERERCWVAERGGEFAGCVCLVKHSETIAKLRLLLVEPAARGQGIGTRLVEECVHFARQAGYGSISLWTNDVLVAARRLYDAAGFRLVLAERHHSFGHDLVGETWELTL